MKMKMTMTTAIMSLALTLVLIFKPWKTEEKEEKEEKEKSVIYLTEDARKKCEQPCLDKGSWLHYFSSETKDSLSLKTACVKKCENSSADYLTEAAWILASRACDNESLHYLMTQNADKYRMYSVLKKCSGLPRRWEQVNV